MQRAHGDRYPLSVEPKQRAVQHRCLSCAIVPSLARQDKSKKITDVARIQWIAISLSVRTSVGIPQLVVSCGWWRHGTPAAQETMLKAVWLARLCA
jgi:hypothetical protein